LRQLPACWYQAKTNARDRLKKVFSNIWVALRDLPIPIRRICYVQLFAWSGFFPMMFYSTTWVASQYKLQFPDTTDDAATRQGSLSLLAQSVVAVLASVILPLFQAIGQSEFILSQPPGKFWNLVRWSLTWVTPRNIWTASHIFFVIVISTTFAVHTAFQASAVVAMLGVAWAVTCWVPFGILMEFIRELEAGAILDADEVISASEIMLRLEEDGEEEGGLSVPGQRGNGSGSGSRSPSGRRRSNASARSRTSSRRSSRSSMHRGARVRAQKALTECRPLLEGVEEDIEAIPDPPEQVGGTILGIHNLAIVSPQFIVRLTM
jgi:solute carrier family 45 protein 1/2/4